MESGLISDLKISTVVPAKVTGDNKPYELTDMDLAMKLHYIKAVYFYHSEAVEGLTVRDLKEPMFRCLVMHYTASGRIRRSSEDERPFIRCNDGGVRVVEANCCEKTVDEWLEMEDKSLDFDRLVYDHVLGPDLGFSPLVFLQFTWFKCGGLSVGLSWAHVLGDAFSASSFMNTWSRILAAGHHQPPHNSLQLPNKPKPSTPAKLLAMKQIDPVGDHWLIPNTRKLATHIFTIPTNRLDELLSNLIIKSTHFDLISAIIWKLISKIRHDKGGIESVTIVTNNNIQRDHEISTNDMVISSVLADNCEAAEGKLSEIATLIAEKKVDQNGIIEHTMKAEEKLDFIVYGANLTFLNLEGLNAYDLEIKGHKPVFVNYGINGLGDEGLVVVIPGPEVDGAIVERTVTVVLPENEINQFKMELQNGYGNLLE